MASGKVNAVNRGKKKCVPVVVTFVSLTAWVELGRSKLLDAFVKLPSGPVVPAGFTRRLEMG